uniref:Uncharacterized protein n=1 Tax=Anguilla anguilla TaxID=7936 RepID=A0A0E9S9I3_ANGAN
MCLTGVVKRTNYSTKLLHPWKQFSVGRASNYCYMQSNKQKQ